MLVFRSVVIWLLLYKLLAALLISRCYISDSCPFSDSCPSSLNQGRLGCFLAGCLDFNFFGVLCYNTGVSSNQGPQYRANIVGSYYKDTHKKGSPIETAIWGKTFNLFKGSELILRWIRRVLTHAPIIILHSRDQRCNSNLLMRGSYRGRMGSLMKGCRAASKEF